MENDRVRVLDVWVKPGEKTEMHSHPDRVVYVFSNKRLKFTTVDGQNKELELKAGQVLWIEAGSHVFITARDNRMNFLKYETINLRPILNLSFSVKIQ
jgi:quercetin dioxygenase-like cupin family protein